MSAATLRRPVGNVPELATRRRPANAGHDLLMACIWLGVLLMPLLSGMGAWIPVLGMAPQRLLAIALLFAVVMLRPRWNRTAAWVAAIGLLWGVYAIMRLWAPLGSKELVSVVLGFTTAWAMVVTLGERDWLRTLTRGWLLAWIVSFLPAVREILTGQHMSNYLEFSSPYVRAQSHFVGSFYVNPNLYAFFIGAAMIFLGIGWHAESGRWLRLLYLCCFMASLPLIWLTGSRTTSVISAIYLVWFLLGIPAVRRMWRPLLAGAIALVGLAVVAVGALTALPAHLLDSSGSSRLALYRDGWWMFLRTGGFGEGTGAFEQIIATRVLPHDPGSAQNPHSAVNEVLSQYGFVVAIPLLVALLALVRFGWPAVRRRYPDPVSQACLQALALTVVLLPVSTLANSSNLESPVLWTLVGSLLVLFERQRRLGVQPEPAWMREAPVSLPRRARLLRRVVKANSPMVEQGTGATAAGKDADTPARRPGGRVKSHPVPAGRTLRR